MYQKKIIVWIVALSAVFLVGTFAAALAQPDSSQQSAEDLYQSALMKKEAEGDLKGAVKLFQDDPQGLL